MVCTCRKRTISAPKLETSRHERWEQKLAKDIRKQQKIFYHTHVYVKNVRPFNFLFVPLFPNLFDVPLFPTIFWVCSRVRIAKFPVFPCSVVLEAKILLKHHAGNLNNKFSKIQ